MVTHQKIGTSINLLVVTKMTRSTWLTSMLWKEKSGRKEKPSRKSEIVRGKFRSCNKNWQKRKDKIKDWEKTSKLTSSFYNSLPIRKAKTPPCSRRAQISMKKSQTKTKISYTFSRMGLKWWTFQREEAIKGLTKKKASHESFRRTKKLMISRVSQTLTMRRWSLTLQSKSRLRLLHWSNFSRWKLKLLLKFKKANKFSQAPWISRKKSHNFNHKSKPRSQPQTKRVTKLGLILQLKARVGPSGNIGSRNRNDNYMHLNSFYL